ncbi:MAG: hypothetical protein ACI9JL_000155 [Paracoccaceae bacterium]|jgi:hypothetical protein
MRQFGILLGGIAALVLYGQSAHADIAVQFTEAAPKDRFVVTNRTTCEIASGAITIDLSTSTSGLLFDTDPSGPGENVAQPFEIARSESVSASFANVSDGATTAEIRVRNFLPGGRIEVTVDVDDSVRSGPRGVQMIDASEMAGARVTFATGPDVLYAATFDSGGQARIELAGCPGT